jgi:hypothetical protein
MELKNLKKTLKYMHSKLTRLFNNDCSVKQGVSLGVIGLRSVFMVRLVLEMLINATECSPYNFINVSTKGNKEFELN